MLLLFNGVDFCCFICYFYDDIFVFMIMKFIIIIVIFFDFIMRKGSLKGKCLVSVVIDRMLVIMGCLYIIVLIVYVILKKVL